MSNFNYAITLKQPWAWLVVKGFQNIIERPPYSIEKDFGGQRVCYIHAGIKFDNGAYLALRKKFKMPHKDKFKIGGIVGKVLINDSVRYEPGLIGKWWIKKRYGIIISEPEEIDFVPIKGWLRPFPFPTSVFEEHEMRKQDLILRAVNFAHWYVENAVKKCWTCDNSIEKCKKCKTRIEAEEILQDFEEVTGLPFDYKEYLSDPI